MRAPRILLLGLCAALAACAAKKPPPPQRLTLGESQVEYRDYGLVKGSLCGSDPRRLGPELQKINELLEQFVAKSEDATKPDATAEQVEVLREGSKALGPVVQAHTKNLAGLNACGFKTKPPFPDITKKGNEVLTAAKARLDEAPTVLADADRRLAEKKWREDSNAREVAAKQTFCTAKTQVGSGDLYFAREEPHGKTHWMFCDGIVVEQASGAEPAVIIPDTISKKDRKRIQEKRYLDAAKGLPAEEIDKVGAEKKTEAKE
ncbi:hypothetical protein [Hyalangium versicolor]|uniref:hypothetical protein n=1 Tax=Hyalangium versicolor TaxID=2861190 RepID=UPI001CC99C4E|nr:hypothetical protein [Hyalangium versicolor]